VQSRVKRLSSHQPPVADTGNGFCAICQEEVSPAQDETAGAIVQLPCNHRFHSSCISSCSREWESICPLCKKRYSHRSLRARVERQVPGRGGAGVGRAALCQKK
jgi:hypothetical protein